MTTLSAVIAERFANVTRESVGTAIDAIVSKQATIDSMIQEAAIGVIWLAEAHNCAIMANRLVNTFPKNGSRRKVLTAFLLKFGKFARNNGADKEENTLRYHAKGNTNIEGADAVKWSEFKTENGASKSADKSATEKLEKYVGKLQEAGMTAADAFQVFGKTWSLTEEQLQAINAILAPTAE